MQLCPMRPGDAELARRAPSGAGPQLREAADRTRRTQPGVAGGWLVLSRGRFRIGPAACDEDLRTAGGSRASCAVEATPHIERGHQLTSVEPDHAGLPSARAPDGAAHCDRLNRGGAVPRRHRDGALAAASRLTRGQCAIRSLPLAAANVRRPDPDGELSRDAARGSDRLGADDPTQGFSTRAPVTHRNWPAAARASSCPLSLAGARGRCTCRKLR
jgi:hypothetical protein